MKIDFIFDEGSSKEDSCLVRDNIFGVFDGFDSLDKFTDKGGKTGGLIASTIAADVFAKNDKCLRDLTIEANLSVRKRMIASNINISKKSSLWGTALAVVKIKDNSFEWIQISDSLILIIYRNNSFKVIVKDYDHDKKVLKIWKKFANQKKDNIRELIDKNLLKLRNCMNETYGCLNGEQKAISFLKECEEKLKNVKHIILFTDGLFIPKEDPFKDDDWDMFVNLFLKGGLKNIRDFVRNLEKEDPKCWKYPRYKQYDDIAAISISF